MRTHLTRALSLILALLTFTLCACTPKSNENTSPSDLGNADNNQTPDDPSSSELSAAEASFLTFDFSKDEQFLPKNIYDQSMYTNGIVPTKDGDNYYVQVLGQDHASRAIVFKGEYGKCYEIKCPAGIKGLRAAVITKDPRKQAVGTKISYDSDMSLKYYSSKPAADKAVSFMFNARSRSSYLVLYTGTEMAEIEILERTMIQETDTEGLWFYPETVGGIKGGENPFSDHRWNVEEFFNNLYEPYRAKYPEYISREHIGKDQSGKYDMYGYVFEPEEYKCTIFIASGVHGNEEVGYHSLAAFMSMVCDATADGDPLLWFLRNNVRFITIPLVNVWAASQDHTGNGEYTRKRLRYNSTNTDLNRDFKDLTQQESKNVVAYFSKYASEVDVMFDCHTAGGKVKALWYNFINFSENAVVNYKTTNHMFQRMKELGHCGSDPVINHIPGSYTKGSQYLEGVVWNKFNVSSITVEHANYDYDDSRYGTSSEVTLAVEAYGNFIIQNALYYCNKK